MAEPVIEMLRTCHQQWSHTRIPSNINFPLTDSSVLKRFEDFTSQHQENSFERTNLFGHFTGSALLTNSDYSKVLLTFHAKLNKWLQLGGHADGDHDLARVAEREVCEESGLDKVSRLNWMKESKAFLPFDFDVHLIPENKKDPKHFHFDVRFLFVTDHPELIKISAESMDLKWFTWEEAKQVTNEESTLRQLVKFQSLLQNRSLYRLLDSN